MKRHGHDEVDRRVETGKQAHHEPAQDAGAVGAVAMFETKDQRATVIVVDQRGTGAIERRRVGEAGTAQGRARDLEIERQATAGAMGRVDEGQTPPATRAKTLTALDLLAAGRTARRQ